MNYHDRAEDNAVRLVIVGATGMVGSYALRYALNHPAVARVTAIGRRKLGISHPKLDQVLHQDFADCSALAEALLDHDGAVFCLGTDTGSRLPLTTPSSSIGFCAPAAHGPPSPS